MPNDYEFVSTGSQNELLINCELNGRNFTAMSVQLSYVFTSYKIPNVNTIIIGRAVNVIIIFWMNRRKDNTTEDSVRTAKIMSAIIADYMPDFDRGVSARSGH